MNLVINHKTFDSLVWNDETNFDQDMYNVWLHVTAMPALQQIYDELDEEDSGSFEQCILGDIINILSNTQIIVEKPNNNK